MQAHYARVLSVCFVVCGAAVDRWHPDLTEEEVQYLDWFAARPVLNR
jgi:hypothetical protein